MTTSKFITSAALLLAISITTRAFPVSHWEQHTFIPSHQYQGQPLPKPIQHSHHSEHHKSQADVYRWVDSLFADEHSSLGRRKSPSKSSHEHESTKDMRPADIHQASQKNKEWLKWVEDTLNEDDDHHSSEHETTTSSTHAAVTSSQPTQHKSPSVFPPLTVPSNSHGRSTQRNAHLAPMKNVYKSRWSDGRSYHVKEKIRTGLDQLAIARYGASSRNWRSVIAGTLTKAQLDHLGKGLSPFNMPGIVVESRDAPESLEKGHFSLSKGTIKKSWKEGFNDTEIKTILEFSDLIMAQRGATATSARNRHLSSLSKEELKAIARGDEAEKKRILVKLAPKGSRNGKGYYRKSKVR
jgi:hypothetical protein